MAQLSRHALKCSVIFSRSAGLCEKPQSTRKHDRGRDHYPSSQKMPKKNLESLVARFYAIGHFASSPGATISCNSSLLVKIHKSPRRVPHSALLSRVGGFVEALDVWSARAFGRAHMSDALLVCFSQKLFKKH